MWFRVTCPNGHPLENELLKQAVHSKRCPECNAKVSMWTKVTCSNGHTLKVKTKHGGGQGACPECKTAVTIPEFDIERFIDVLLPKKATAVRRPARSAEEAKPVKAAAVLQKTDYYARMFKPDLVRKPLNCSGCRTVLFPGATICGTCGRPVE